MRSSKESVRGGNGAFIAPLLKNRLLKKKCKVYKMREIKELWEFIIVPSDIFTSNRYFTGIFFFLIRAN